MTEPTLPIDLPGLPPLSEVMGRAQHFLDEQGSTSVVDGAAPIPNPYMGLWIVDYVTQTGEWVEGGAIAVSKDDVWYIGSAPDEPEYVGLFPTFDPALNGEPEPGDAPEEVVDDEVEMAALLTLFDASDEAEMDALLAFALTAAGGGNPDQLRVPKGNGDLSGRWVDMPASLLSRLAPTDASGARAVSIDLRDATPEDKAAFKTMYGKPIPPAWTDVKVDLNDGAELIAKGKDAKGRSVYLYTDAYRAKQDAAKFARLGHVFQKVDDLEKGLATVDGDPTKAVARLMMVEGIRVGSTDEQRGKVKAYGASTLEVQHAKVLPNGNVSLEFTAKEGIPVRYEIDDPELVQFLTERLALDLPEGSKIFETDADRTMALLRDITGLPMKNHDLRTLLANRLALLEIREVIPPPPDSPKAFAAARKAIAEKVAAQLRNKPAQALASYISPAVFSPLAEGL